MTFQGMWADLLPVGRRADGGYQRFAWTAADMQCREWFRAGAARRGMDVETDRNGNLWAWLGAPGPDAVVTGSHLDSVPGGGAYDGPLGIVSAFAAIDALDRSALRRPLAVVAFTDEEGARFGVACLGSRLAAGVADPERTLALKDPDGTTLAEAMRAQGHDPSYVGPDPEALQRIGLFVELHVEQGRALEAPVGLGTAIWPHGRWRYDFRGEGNHAGTTALADRRDPMLSYAMTVLAARKRARLGGALATFGRVHVDPG
ncbi:MAG: allantoate amidohydrolase, partial [Actinomycetota bacterium]|nr:allantoate amidohydrolase [Actinomycetota bacterium]